MRAIAANSPATEFVQRESIAAVQGDQTVDLPVADHSIEDRVHIATELLAMADGQLINHVAGNDVRLVPVARSPLFARVVDVFPARLATGTGCSCAAPAGS